MSGSERPYDPDRYNRYAGLKNSNNCYAYAMEYDELPSHCTKEKCNAPFPQPGLSAGHKGWTSVKGKRCPDVMARVMGDVPESYLADFTQRCKKGMRKVAFVVDPKEDYHVYRQDAPRKGDIIGYWSDKPGSTEVKQVDTSGRLIYDPQLAARHAPDSRLNYTHFCGYLCVPATKPKLTRSKGGKRKGRRTRRAHTDASHSVAHRVRKSS